MKIELIGATIYITKGSLLITRPSSMLFYDLQNSQLNIHNQYTGDFIIGHASNDIQNNLDATLGSDVLVRAYLDTIIGVVKTV
jgi:hypothetical protein